MKLKIALLLAAIVAANLGCNSSSSGPSLPNISLPKLSTGLSESLASCPTPKCLTVYVAPWCHYCRSATPMILGLRDYLKQHGVETRVIVGLDKPEALQSYAREFGSETLLDVNSSVSLSGVPHFYVTNASGEILKDVGGLPGGVERAETLASIFDLP